MPEDALVEGSEAWEPREATQVNELYNKERRAHLSYVYEAFLVVAEAEDPLD